MMSSPMVARRRLYYGMLAPLQTEASAGNEQHFKRLGGFLSVRPARVLGGPSSDGLRADWTRRAPPAFMTSPNI